MQRLIDWADSHRGYWLDCVRIYLGVGLFTRGLLLITNSSVGFFEDLVQRSGQSWLTNGVLLHYVILAHFVGGFLLTIGFLTRLAALIQIPVLIGALFFVHRAEGLLATSQSFEFSALVLFLLLVFVVSGAGRLSVDYVTFGEKQPALTDEHPLVT